MTQTPEPGAPEELSADDAKALARLLRRGLGKGFRLVILEVATWRVRSRILAWVRDQIARQSGSVVEIDVATLPGENLWSELGERVTVDEARRSCSRCMAFRMPCMGSRTRRTACIGSSTCSAISSCGMLRACGW